MRRSARGFFRPVDGFPPEPAVWVGISFGPGKIVATRATVDTGADLCVFPPEAFPWSLDGFSRGPVSLHFGSEFEIEGVVYAPTLTVGHIRIPEVKTAILPGFPALLGRTFLNECTLRLAAAEGEVLLERESPALPTRNP